MLEHKFLLQVLTTMCCRHTSKRTDVKTVNTELYSPLRWDAFHFIFLTRSPDTELVMTSESFFPHWAEITNKEICTCTHRALKAGKMYLLLNSMDIQRTVCSCLQAFSHMLTALLAMLVIAISWFTYRILSARDERRSCLQVWILLKTLYITAGEVGEMVLWQCNSRKKVPSSSYTASIPYIND